MTKRKAKKPQRKGVGTHGRRASQVDDERPARPHELPMQSTKLSQSPDNFLNRKLTPESLACLERVVPHLEAVLQYAESTGKYKKRAPLPAIETAKGFTATEWTCNGKYASAEGDEPGLRRWLTIISDDESIRRLRDVFGTLVDKSEFERNFASMIDSSANEVYRWAVEILKDVTGDNKTRSISQKLELAKGYAFLFDKYCKHESEHSWVGIALGFFAHVILQEIVVAIQRAERVYDSKETKRKEKPETDRLKKQRAIEALEDENRKDPMAGITELHKRAAKRLRTAKGRRVTAKTVYNWAPEWKKPETDSLKKQRAIEALEEEKRRDPTADITALREGAAKRLRVTAKTVYKWAPEWTG